MKPDEEQRLYWNVAVDAERRCQDAEWLAAQLEAEHQDLLQRLQAARREFHLAFLERAELSTVLKKVGFGEDQIQRVHQEVKAQVGATVRRSSTLVLV